MSDTKTNQKIYIPLLSKSRSRGFYQNILMYGLAATIGLGAVGCKKVFNKAMSTETGLVSGKIYSEEYQKNIIDPNQYFFTLASDDGMRVFECSNDYDDQVRKMDLLLNKGDEVTIKIPDQQRERKNNFSVCLEDVVSVNGKSVPQ